MATRIHPISCSVLCLSLFWECTEDGKREPNGKLIDLFRINIRVLYFSPVSISLGRFLSKVRSNRPMIVYGAVHTSFGGLSAAELQIDGQ